ncbi:MAG: Gx transporter family protein [Sphaerochaetaceae bacterium]
MTQPSKSVRIEFVALLAAFALFLSTVEYMIPKPLPFMRLGLANLPLMIALGVARNKEYALLSILKVLGQALVTGTLFSYIALFSVVGTFASVAVMLVLYHVGKKQISLIGIGVGGAMASNIAQLVLSYYLLFGDAALLIATPFLAVGLISSLILGIFAHQFVTQSRWYQRYL